MSGGERLRVVVAMSGGVDSSVVAALMHEAGHDVVGLTMKLRDSTADERAGGSGSCCSADDTRDAREVCDRLGVPHFVVDYRDAFRKAVMEPFARAYLEGQTPNPCVLCNDHLKFAALLGRAKALGADVLATGHYARVEGDAATGWVLRRAVDESRDQSYFLFGLNQRALSRVWFPLGGMEKTDVRAHARRFNLEVADKPDSEDICFVPDGDYARVVSEILEGRGLATPGPGPIIDAAGEVLGEHRGVHHFTVGQRRGLGVARGERLYVLSVDAPTSTVVVGDAQALRSSGFVARDASWVDAEPSEGGLDCTVRIRSRHRGASARVELDGAEVRVRFSSPEPAVTPGQAAVFYDGDRVLGGAWIAAPLAVAPGA
jgi:tRNA-specific 2-thiouridylase